ncbi:MAG: hypothetical protein KW806_02360 [Candidatus Yanofskybacteria bacterium]|nr:hypothetical protein [Candidatus Yanofskybacteria bacterium]
MFRCVEEKPIPISDMTLLRASLVLGGHEEDQGVLGRAAEVVDKAVEPFRRHELRSEDYLNESHRLLRFYLHDMGRDLRNPENREFWISVSEAISAVAYGYAITEELREHAEKFLHQFGTYITQRENACLAHMDDDE